MKWISVKQAAEKLGISPSAVWKRLKKDKWRYKKVGRAFLIVEEDIMVPEVPPGRIKFRDFAERHGLRLQKLQYRVKKYKIHTEVHAKKAYLREADTERILECYHKDTLRGKYKRGKNEPEKILVRFHDCKDYEKCLNTAAYKNRHFDCRSCDNYKKQKEEIRRWEDFSNLHQSCVF